MSTFADDGAVALEAAARQAMHRLVEQLATSAATVSFAESFTGGLATYLAVDQPGAGDVVCGGIVAYAPGAKASLLGVPNGPFISAACALQMARQVKHRLGSHSSLAFTGVAGPDQEEGRAVGTVFVAACCGSERLVIEEHLPGSPNEVRLRTIQHAADLLVALLRRE